MKHKNFTSINFSIFHSSTEPHIKNCVCVDPVNIKLTYLQVSRPLHICGGLSAGLAHLPTVLLLFSPFCLSGHILKFPQDQVVMQSRFSSHLKDAVSGVVHFTSGIGMSSQTREYLTLTAHWVTFASAVRPHCEDHHCSALLDVSQIDCDYSGNSIQKQLECWWEAWVTSIGLQIDITVTDNPSIGKMLSEGEHSSVQCFSHTVNLIVSEAIKSQRMVQNY